jgi:lipopolysaccharide transport system ATP-binding protein
MSDIAIKVEDLSKLYKIGARQGGSYKTLRESIMGALTGPFRRMKKNPGSRIQNPEPNIFWALKDVSFEVTRGEVVGIIGRNGAGKTTLLKILSRITEPTQGKAEIHGRVGSLLEVGTGFHPELTGRENIYLNGAILGMRKTEIERKFIEIIGFAEIEKFIDTPVKRYSSGMYVRLAFAVAAHLEPEILLVDEVLAVGDAAFQKKCLGKMDGVAKEGRTVLFVSHNMAAVQSLCNTAYLLDQGKITASGRADTVIGYYLETMQCEQVPKLADRVDRRGNGKLRFLSFSAHSIEGRNSLVSGSLTELTIAFEGEPPLHNVNISLGLYTLLGEGVMYLSNQLVGMEFSEVPPHGSFICRFRKLPLRPGTYMVNFYGTVNGILADWIIDGARIEVAEGDYFGTGKLPAEGYGAVMVDHEWDVIHH